MHAEEVEEVEEVEDMKMSTLPPPEVTKLFGNRMSADAGDMRCDR